MTLITGARQVGKTALCQIVSEKYGFGYVSLAGDTDRLTALRDSKMFLQLHPAPVIIDEVQYVPELFSIIKGIVDERKFKTGSNTGMYVLTRSQSYSRIEGITQSMAGRAGIIEMHRIPSASARSWAATKSPSKADFEENIRRSSEYVLPAKDVYRMIVRGGYPELYDKPSMKTAKFYSDYADTYINRDVSQIINLKDLMKFRMFMEYAASITGQELVYDSISRNLGISIHTVQS